MGTVGGTSEAAEAKLLLDKEVEVFELELDDDEADEPVADAGLAVDVDESTDFELLCLDLGRRPSMIPAA